MKKTIDYETVTKTINHSLSNLRKDGFDDEAEMFIGTIMYLSVKLRINDSAFDSDKFLSDCGIEL